MSEWEWPPFDLDRLDSEERKLWDQYVEPNDGDGRDGPYTRVYGFGHICMIELGRIPDAVHEFMDDGRIAEAMTQYLTNMREKRRREREAERGAEDSG